MHSHKDAKQTAYYRRQAYACATAASATAIAEVKEAYLNLEQGWLCLAPKVEERLANPKSGCASESAFRELSHLHARS
jgi:hypothetical protein